MVHSKQVIEKIVAMKEAGISSREISKLLFKTESKKSTINDIYNRYLQELANKPVARKYEEVEEDNSRILLISDMHIPYHHQDTFKFLQYLKNKYKPTRIISLGDECFPEEAELMTERGWISFKDYVESFNSGDVYKVVQVEDSQYGCLVEPDRTIYKESVPELLRYEHKTMISNTTPKHNIVKINPSSGKLHRREAWDDEGTASWEIPRNLKGFNGCGVDFSDNQLRLITSYQADGCLTKGAMRFCFKKERKCVRLEKLLKSLEIPYNTHNIGRGDKQYYVEVSNTPDYINKHFYNIFSPCQMNHHQMQVFLEEVKHWDSCDKGDRFRYVSKNLDNVEFVQQVAVLSGKSARKIGISEGSYYVDIIESAERCTLKSAKKVFIKHDKPVYCVTVPSGMILTRQEGWVSVSGNCDKHALSYHDSDPDLLSAGDELSKSKEYIKQLKEMFPKMDILDSNHGSMVWRKAKTHGIPKAYIKSYQEVLGVNDNWKWHFDLTITLPNGQKVYFHHGKSSDVVKLSQQMGMNAVQGHFHERMNINYWGNSTGLYWGLQVGCLIDDDSMAFAYNNVNIKRPVIGTGLIINNLPVLEPMVLGKNGRWIGA